MLKMELCAEKFSISIPNNFNKLFSKTVIFLLIMKCGYGKCQEVQTMECAQFDRKCLNVYMQKWQFEKCDLENSQDRGA